MSANNVTLRQLRAFIAIADRGSFVAAAHALNLSQPALSQSIRQLEEQVGSPLLSRTTRSVGLTQLGMSFLPHARDLVTRFDTLMGAVEEVVARRRGQVTIACLPSVAARLMPRVVALNEKRFPGIRVVIRDTNMKGVVALLSSGEADLGIGSALAEPADLESAELGQDEMHAVLPVTSPLARRRTLHWGDLAGQPFISLTRETGVRELIDEASARGNVTLSIVAEVSNFATLTAMIEEGIGISALPSLTLPRSHAFIRTRPLGEPRVRRTIRMFWKAGLGLSPAAAGIVTALRECIATEKALTQAADVQVRLRELEEAPFTR